MPTSVVLASWTEQGMHDVAGSPSRLDAVRDLAESLGGTFEQFFMTMGAHDMVALMEFPDDDAWRRWRCRSNGAETSRRRR